MQSSNYTSELTGIEPHALHARVEALLAEAIAIRRDIHAHPELAFEETRTSEIVASRLEKFGLAPRRNFGRTGVVAMIEGGRSGPCVGFRVDMDALPVQTTTTAAYRSRYDGKMHACGHDMHIAIGLGVAEILAGIEGGFPGRVKMIFQPAEETVEGALAMIADGVLEDPKLHAILGLHNSPDIEAGLVGYLPRTAMAGADVFDISVTGVGGHASQPDRCIDALSAACDMATALRGLVARELPPAKTAVLTIGSLAAGTVRNVVAAHAELKGTLRTLDPESAPVIEAAVRRVAAGLAAATRTKIEVAWSRVAPVLANDPAALKKALAGVAWAIGADNIVELEKPSMGAEDFAFFAERVPAAHLRIGSGRRPFAHALHRANFDIEERSIGTAIQASVGAIWALLGCALKHNREAENAATK
jgi:amidohydrolase